MIQRDNIKTFIVEKLNFYLLSDYKNTLLFLQHGVPAYSSIIRITPGNIIKASNRDIQKKLDNRFNKRVLNVT